jgi:DNA primase
MALPASFTDELRARTPLPAVVGRRVRLARSGKQWKGCCPFHGEKSPSFFVWEDHYHCYGCGAHGDAISFVMQSQGLSFMEAIGQLAAEAGLEVPKPTPEAAEAERRRLDVVGVLQAAQVHYQRRLTRPEGRPARDYLLGRGLTEETIARFGLGWTGDRGALTADLATQGIDIQQLADAGLIRRDEETGRAFELFSQRVMFPIHDRRGSIISFGGRILGPGQPKYVNGPETSVFSKRRNLYGLDLARDGVRNGGTLIVVEGYMDVIATAQAGFTAAVAPLGTALTNEQIEELWRVSPCPVLCFDGDTAGIRAAARVMELALPLLTPERSLKFATLPTGEDPDSLVRKHGTAGFQSVLNDARGPTDALYDMVLAEVGDKTPEQRAALRSRLDEAAGRVADKTLAWEYRDELRKKFRESHQSKFYQGGSSVRFGDSRRVRAAPVRFVRLQIDQTSTITERYRILTASLLRHPYLLQDGYVRNAYESLSLDGPLARLQTALLDWTGEAETLDFPSLMGHLTESGCSSEIEQVFAKGALPLPRCTALTAILADVVEGWWHFFGLLSVERLREEVVLAKMDADRNPTTETEFRLNAMKGALLRVESGEADGAGQVDA